MVEASRCMLRAGAHGLQRLGLVLRPLDRWVAIPMPGIRGRKPAKSAEICQRVPCWHDRPQRDPGWWYVPRASILGRRCACCCTPFTTDRTPQPMKRPRPALAVLWTLSLFLVSVGAWSALRADPVAAADGSTLS